MTRTEVASATELLARIQQAWLPFRVAAASLGHKRIEEPTPAGWTYKQMLGHVAAWHESAARRIAAFRVTGSTASDPKVNAALFEHLGIAAHDKDALLREWDMDRFNAAVAAASAAKDAQTVLREVDASFDRLRAAVSGLTEEQIASHVEEGRGWAVAIIAGDSYGHYAEHQEEIATGVPCTAAELLERLKQAWGPFRSVVSTVGVRDLSKRTSSGWTVKGLLGHLTYWMETVPKDLLARLRGERPAATDVNAANAAASAAADARSAEDVLRAFDDSYKGVVAALGELDGARGIPAMVVGSVAARTYANFLEHASELKALRPRTRDELIARIESEWRVFRDAVRHLGRARIGEAIAEGWTYRDVIAHAAAWMEALPGWLRGIRAGGDPWAAFGKQAVDDFNARAAAERKLVGPEAIVDELDTAYRGTLAEARGLTDDEVADRRVFALFAWCTYLHFEEHYGELGVAIP